MQKCYAKVIKKYTYWHDKNLGRNLYDSLNV